MIQSTQTKTNTDNGISSVRRSATLEPVVKGENQEPLALLNVRTPIGLTRGLEPIRQGVPLAKGAVHDDSAIIITDSHGRTITSQSRVLSRWADGSIQWLLVDFFHALSSFQVDDSNEYFETSYKLTSGQLASANKADVTPETPWGTVSVGEIKDGNSLFRIGNQWDLSLIHI